MEHDHSQQLDKLRELGAKLELLKTSDGWKSWLRTAASFREYSFGNQILIWSQMPSATRVAGYRAWQKLERQVIRGSKGIRIIAPMVLRSVDDAGDDVHALRFRVVSVFDISQTAGEPVPELEESVWARVVAPEGFSLAMLVDQVHARSDLVVSMATAGPGQARGWYQPKDRSVNIVVAPEPSMIRTLLHELGHAHDAQLTDELAGYVEHRGKMELVAEASAWLAGQRLGVEMDEPSCVYLASWKGTDEVIMSLAQRVIASANQTVQLLLPSAVPVLG